MDTETYIVEGKRTITETQQHICDACGEPATSACTDAIQTHNGWQQSSPRYGCPIHRVTPKVEYLCT
jgi:hypothetical protein